MIRQPSEPLSGGSVVMVVVAAVGLFSAFTLIICLLALSRRRVRTDAQIDSLNRSFSPAAFGLCTGAPPSAGDSPKFDFRPPTYEEAVRMGVGAGGVNPAASNVLDLPSGSAMSRRSHSPPPAFSEIDPLPHSSNSRSGFGGRPAELPPSFPSAIRVDANRTGGSCGTEKTAGSWGSDGC
ncbi:hypothetical protein M3Y99_01739300 [Aphelenchoides fujianensis]|nr:hypothetical protein M3Y99_01739300 [Aphelenchoides fujianensis]